MTGCYIIDDESYAIEVLSDYVLQTPGLHLTGTSQDPVTGLHNVLATKPDVLFLDVDMPKLSGFDIIGLLGNRLPVVLTTAHPNYAVEAFSMDASDFLLKPISYKRFLRCIEKLFAMESHHHPGASVPSATDFIFIQSGAKGKMVKIRFEDIQYIESYNNYLVIHCLEENHTIYMSLKDLMGQLPRGIFVRVHKSYIINYHYIRALDGNRVFLNSAIELPIGSQYREDFLKTIKADTLKRK